MINCALINWTIKKVQAMQVSVISMHAAQSLEPGEAARTFKQLHNVSED